jgi:branched-chain amino acid transport system ATP-binding protein
MHLLEGKGVTKNFGGLTAVSGVDFFVDKGEILGLIGPNGAGKTTLFNLISASLVPKPGKIFFKDKNITGLKPHQICRLGIARTFQTVKIFANLSILDNVRAAALFGSAKSPSDSQATKEALELLEFVGLSQKVPVDSPAKDLTLANQKRLEVARALATKPELILLDELMAGLNPTEVGEAMEDIREIRRDRGITVIMIEHVMKAIMNVCDRIVVLNYGKKIAEGTPQEIVNSKTVIEVYLGEQTNVGS